MGGSIPEIKPPPVTIRMMEIKNGLRSISKWPIKLSIPKAWIQVRGYAPIGIMEYWNIGKMGLGIQQYWVNGKLRLDAKVLNLLYSLKTH